LVGQAGIEPATEGL